MYRTDLGKRNTQPGNCIKDLLSDHKRLELFCFILSRLAVRWKRSEDGAGLSPSGLQGNAAATSGSAVRISGGSSDASILKPARALRSRAREEGSPESRLVITSFSAGFCGTVCDDLLQAVPA